MIILSSRSQTDIYNAIKSDSLPLVTHEEFIKEIGGSEDLRLESKDFDIIKKKLMTDNHLFERIKKILNSNFVKMTFPAILCFI